MRTIGQRIKETREQKGLSVAELEKKTKIKPEFIKAIENNEWSNLPEYPVLQGFIKNIADALGLDTKQAVALLRRDYPPKQLRVNPKPDIKSKFSWGPRITFVVGLMGVALVVLSYLGYQYFQFTQPPSLEVFRPEQGQEIFQAQMFVEGETDPEATLVINNQPTVVEDDGAFSTEIEITPETKEVVITATSRSEKQTTIVREIRPMLEQ